jgi:DNA-binding NtrC family response regulator
VLTQFGFAHGWRMAEAMQSALSWDSDEEWRRAGSRIHALEGLYRVAAGGHGPLSREGAMLVASYEAEQHLLHFGLSEVPVCWTISGLISGYIEAANNGTLLLDEVGEVSPGMQVKLLRALQEREIRRVGENRSRRVDVRVVAATNRDLAHGVAGGAFRQDLYYRLKVVALHVPPLRERRDDVLPLARVLLADAALRMKRKISGLAPAALDQLLRYGWPANVRELENAMERAVALARASRVELEDLPEEVRRAFPTPAVTSGTVRPLEEVEKEYILAALELNGGNQTHTAGQLRIGSATLYRKLRSYGLIGTRKVAQPRRKAAARP